jgi:hypothetical protein
MYNDLRLRRKQRLPISRKPTKNKSEQVVPVEQQHTYKVRGLQPIDPDQLERFTCDTVTSPSRAVLILKNVNTTTVLIRR